MKTFHLILHAIFVILTLCMPWCYGYLIMAQKYDLASSAAWFGFLTGTISVILAFTSPINFMDKNS